MENYKALTINMDRINSPSSIVKQFLYPDGAAQVRLTEEGVQLVREANEVRIIARISNAQDIVDILLLKSAIDGVKPEEALPFEANDKGYTNQPVRKLADAARRQTIYRRCELILPCLPYARADRRFVEGDCAGLETFISMLWIAKFDMIRTFDPHNANAMMHKSVITYETPWRQVIQTILTIGRDEKNSGHNVNILMPDEGAVKRYPGLLASKGVPELSGFVNYKILYAQKSRDPETGKLSGFIVPDKSEFLDGPVLIADDLIDGGGTFIGIAQAMQKQDIEQEFHLYVSHGIFSRGLRPIFEYFDRIYTTNTIDNLEFKAPAWEKRLTVYDVMPQLLRG